MTTIPAKNIYFLSDFHLGTPDASSSLEREKRIVQFLDGIKNDAKEIEVYVKETYGLPPSIFKKIVKSSLTLNDPTDEVIDELSLIREIAQSE